MILLPPNAYVLFERLVVSIYMHFRKVALGATTSDMHSISGQHFSAWIPSMLSPTEVGSKARTLTPKLVDLHQHDGGNRAYNSYPDILLTSWVLA